MANLLSQRFRHTIEPLQPYYSEGPNHTLLATRMTVQSIAHKQHIECYPYSPRIGGLMATILDFLLPLKKYVIHISFVDLSVPENMCP